MAHSVIPASDSEPRGARRLLPRQNPHSLFTAGAGLLFSLTLAIDLAVDRPDLDPLALWILLGFCLALAVTALAMGERFPTSVGLASVVVFTAATIYFFSPWGDEQSAVSSAQELPILALYLGWFVRRPVGRAIMFTATLLIVVAVATNPLFWPAGTLGVPTGVQMIVIALFCYEIGSMLWRRSERRVITDQLTGALNHTGFLNRFEQALARSQRLGTPLCLVIIDFDYFKRLNDTHGHAAGDRALAETVELWKRGLRSGDLVGRLGGDEFALMLDRTDKRGATQVIERLRSASEYSWSWGIAQARPTDTGDKVFERADQRLYGVKRGRR